jgi:hypothetical protein
MLAEEAAGQMSYPRIIILSLVGLLLLPSSTLAQRHTLGQGAAVSNYGVTVAGQQTSPTMTVIFTGQQRYPHGRWVLRFAQVAADDTNIVYVPVAAHPCPGPYYVVHLIGEQAECFAAFTDTIPKEVIASLRQNT